VQGAASIAAPAKLNLRLRVLGRRRDGFHELETLMVRLPCLADRIEAEAAGEFSFGCDDPTVPCDERNLVVRAARGFERVAGIRLPWRINLEKRIPHGAGLGGGSSDAAAMLRLLDGLHPGLVDPAKISDLAARLGSDVPFFLGSGPAICRGRGERVKAAAAVPPLPVVLFKPGFGVATPEAYARWQGAEALPGVDFSPQALAWGTLCNDLERPVFAKHLFLAEIRCWLRARDEVAAALMSGSGATMFAILREPSAAPGLVAAALEQLDPTLWTWAGWSEGSAAS
jgi:4-diphosphocytidyl-2-C-methyl-D-erythritol kinase